MKKRKLLIAVLSIMLVVTLCLGLVACDDKDKEEKVTLTSVSVVGNPVYYIEDFDLSKLKLKLTYSNNTEEVVAFDANLVSEEDKEKLVFLDDADNDGKEDKTISFTYNGNAVTFTFSMQHNPSVELKTFDTVKLESKEFYYSEKDFRSLVVTGLPTLEDGTKPTVKERGNGQNNAGTYDVTVQISAPGYITKEITSQLIIKPKEIEVPTIDKTPIYTGDRMNVPITFNGFGDKKPKEYRVTGDLYAYNSNTIDNPYVVKVALVNKTNYVWKDASVGSLVNGTTDDLELNWFIKKQVVDLSEATWTKTTSFLYDKNYHSVGIVLKNRNSRVVKITYSNDAERQKEAKKYTTTASFSIKDEYKDNYEFANQVTPAPMTLNWEIYRERIVLDPSLIKFNGLGENGNDYLYYNGNFQHPTVDEISLSEIISDVEISYSDEGKIDVGNNYSITVVINKTGYEPLSITKEYSIKQKEVKKPYLKENKFKYDAKEHKIVFIVDGITDDQIEKYLEDIVFSGDKVYGTEPRNRKVILELKNNKNLVWDDGTIEPFTIDWEIEKIDLSGLNIDWDYNKPIEYTGNKIELKLNVDATNGIKVVYYNNIEQSIGTHTATAEVSLLYDKEMYKNAENFQVKTLTKDWEIVKKKVQDGTIKWSKSDFIYMETPEHKGTYKVKLENMPIDIVEGIDYRITKNMFVVTGDFNVDFASVQGTKFVERAQIEVLNQNLDFSGIDLSHEWTVTYKPIIMQYKDETYIYNELEFHEPIKVKGELIKDAEIKYSFTDLVQNVGEYVQKVSVTKKGYTCFEKEATLTIKPQKIKKPTLNTTNYVFNGKIRDCGIVNTGIYKLSGNVSEYYPSNDYKVYVDLVSFVRDGNTFYNYIWEDTVEGDKPQTVVLPWSISKLDLPTLTLEYDYNIAKPFVYDGIEHNVVLKNVPAGLTAIYKVYSNGQLLDKNPINHGEYKTVVTFDYGNIDKERCYTVDTINAIDAFNGKEQIWTISQKEIDMQSVAWKIFDAEKDEMSAPIYQKNYLGTETVYEARLVNIPKELENLISITDNKGSANGIYKSQAIIYDEANNYKLINNNLFIDPVDKKSLYNWEIYTNSFDSWLYYEETPAPVRLKFNGETKDIQEVSPAYVKNVTTIEGMAADDWISKNVKAEIISVDGYQSTPVKDIGTYSFVTRISAPGFTASEKIVTLKVLPIRISKPTLINNDDVTITYDGKVKSVSEKFKHNQPKWDENKLYRMDFVTMTNVGTYTPKAVLLSNNYIWSDGTTKEDDPNFALNDTAEDLTFTNSTGTTYTWSIKKI